MGGVETFLYFAFGSNLLKQRLLLKNPSAKYVDIARLDDYRLAFDSKEDPTGSLWEGASATVRHHPGGSVWGTVWELDMADSGSLDSQECGYKRLEISVTASNGSVYTCRTYEMEGEYDVYNRPSPQYKDVIVRGAKQSGLPQQYIKQLEGIEDNGFQGDVPLYNAVIASLQQQET